MVIMHKHKGLERSDNGSWRMHPISQKHKDLLVQKSHDAEIKSRDNTTNYKTTAGVIKGTHKHLGIETKTGALKSHPISQNHKDLKAQQYHDKAVKDDELKDSKKVKTSLKQQLGKTDRQKNEKSVLVKVDSENYLSIDLDKLSNKGIKLTFTRRENNKRRTIGLKIDTNPCKLKSGESIISKSKLVIDEHY